MKKKISIIIPIYNECDSIFKLIDEIYRVLSKKDFEILVVNDGSNDSFLKTFKPVKKGKKLLRCISHKKNIGKSAAMLTGVKNADNDLVCILDGDGQNPPSEILKMLKIWYKQNKKEFLIICGNRIKRQDTLIKRFSSKTANLIREKILKDGCKDSACALKIFRKKDYLRIPYFKNVHRFLPAIFKAFNGNIINIPVIDRKREYGISKFNFHNRFWIGITDLIKVWYLINIKKEKFKC